MELCKFCGCELPEGTEKREDPYEAEVYDNHEEVYICEMCHNLHLAEC